MPIRKEREPRNTRNTRTLTCFRGWVLIFRVFRVFRGSKNFLGEDLGQFLPACQGGRVRLSLR